MFTGIIEELGVIKKIKDTKSGKEFTIQAGIVTEDLQTGDSLAVNGVCLTAVEIKKKSVNLELVEETLNRSNLGDLEVNSKVNLERALTLSTRLGGHLLQGHIETTGVIIDKQDLGDSSYLIVGISPEWHRYCIEKGSIALDGISLTIADIEENFISVALIPQTLKMTTLGFKDIGDTLNVETDVIAKYIENLLYFEEKEQIQKTDLINKLVNWGFGES